MEYPFFPLRFPGGTCGYVLQSLNFVALTMVNEKSTNIWLSLIWCQPDLTLQFQSAVPTQSIYGFCVTIYFRPNRRQALRVGEVQERFI